jgi:hypothetical protein
MVKCILLEEGHSDEKRIRRALVVLLECIYVCVCVHV